MKTVRSLARAFVVMMIGLLLVTSMAPTARAAAQYSSVVLNVGLDASQRNLVWYSDSQAPQSVKLTVKGKPETASTFAPSATGAAAMAGQTYHQATLTGLVPSTTYTYQVGSDVDGWSQAYEFTTAAAGNFDVLAYGDPQLGSGGGVPSDAAAWADTLAYSTGQVPNAAVLLSLGDQVNTASDETEYRDFLAPAQLRQYPLATTIGNHDNGAPAYGQHFAMPNTSATVGTSGTPARTGMGNYWFRQGDVLFLNLNSNNRDDAAHWAWMADVIAKEGASARWKVVAFHHGPYSTASHASDSDIIDRRATWPAKMSEMDIDLVLGGHDHVYSRSHLINRGHAVGDLTAPATLHKFPGEVLWMTLNSSTGSKYYTEMAMKFPFNAVSKQARVPSFTRLSFSDDAIRAVTTERTGTVTDDVTLRRATSGTPAPLPTTPPVVDFWGDGTADTGLGDTPVENVTDPATGVTTVNGRILRGSDDVEEYVTTKQMYLDSSDLELADESPGEEDPQRQLIGLRYDALAIPHGATITSARLQFTVDEPKKSVGESTLTVAVENTGHAAAFTGDAGNVSSRTLLAKTVAWTPAEWPTAQVAGADQATGDLSALVQGIVDRPDWFRGNAMTFVISGTGTRTAEAWEGGTGKEAPQLVVTYTMDGKTELTAGITEANDDVEQYRESGLMDHGSSDLEITQEKQNQIIGLRYPNLQIPQGAIIDQASIQFTTDESAKSTDPFSVNIYGEATDNAAPFSEAAFDLAKRTKTTANVVWGPGVPLWTIDQEQRAAQRTSNIAPALQEIVNRSGWQQGNAAAFLIEGTGIRSAEAFEGGGTAEAPVLRVVWHMPEPKPIDVDVTITAITKHVVAVDARDLPSDAVVTVTGQDKNGKVYTRTVPAGEISQLRVNNWVTVSVKAKVGEKVVGHGEATSPFRELKTKPAHKHR